MTSGRDGNVGEVRVGRQEIELKLQDAREKEKDVRVHLGDAAITIGEVGETPPDVDVNHREDDSVSGNTDTRRQDAADQLREVRVGVQDAGVIDGNGDATLCN